MGNSLETVEFEAVRDHLPAGQKEEAILMVERAIELRVPALPTLEGRAGHPRIECVGAVVHTYDLAYVGRGRIRIRQGTEVEDGDGIASLLEDERGRRPEDAATDDCHRAIHTVIN